ADIYYCRSACMWVGLLAESCRRYGRRSISAAASDAAFVPRQGGQIRYARDRWLYRRGLARVDRIVAQNEVQRASCRATYGRDAVVIPSCYQPLTSPGAAIASRDCVLWVATVRAGKRPELYLELAARLPRRRFVMVGGPDQVDAALFDGRRQAGSATSSSPASCRSRRSKSDSTPRASLSIPPNSKECRIPSCRPGRTACRRSAPWTWARRCTGSFATSRPVRAKSRRCFATRSSGSAPPRVAASTSSATTRAPRRSSATTGCSTG